MAALDQSAGTAYFKKAMEDSRPPGPTAVLRPGENCWRQAHADRVAWLIDGAAYFAALKRALLAAREQVFIIGWSFDSRILLERRDPVAGVPDRLRDLLVHVAERRPELAIRILIWDYTILFASDREPLPALTIAWTTPRNVELVLDDCVPFGAAHHGKFVVIDDRLAFVGGIDITGERWDTPEHLPEDPDRVDPTGGAYAPYHDVQVALDGAAAAAIGELARERWRIAAGHRVAPPKSARNADPWPDGLAPDLRDIEVGIARTVPQFGRGEEVREVERLYLDSVAAARDLIFIENQYFTSDSVTAAIARRLAEPEGPEVVVIVPQRCSGWLEEIVMDTRRAAALRRLADVDAHRRLRVIAPTSCGGAGRCNVHAKLMTVDDRFIRVGSANLNNRSMGLDTELDIAIEDPGDGRIETAVADLRYRLVAEHCRVDPQQVAEACRANGGSLVAAIDRLMTAHDPPAVEIVPPGPEKAEPAPLLAAVADAERPVEPAALAAQIIPEELQPIQRAQKRSHILIALGSLGLLVALAGLWRFTPLADLTSPNAVASWLESFRESPLAPVYAIAAFILLGLVSFPVTVLIGATAIAFGPIEGFGYATAGAMASAAVGFGIGFVGGRRMVRRIAGRRIRALERLLHKQGVLAVAMLHAVPVAPFSVVNIVLGASRVRFVDYMIGTLIGMLPGIVVLAALGDRIMVLLRDPNWVNVAVAVGLLIGWTVVGLAVHRVMVHWRGRGESRAGAVG